MGDAACWLDRVCLDCGRFVDADEVEDDRCSRCGAAWDSTAPWEPHSG